jgi:hypothetical protein
MRIHNKFDQQAIERAENEGMIAADAMAVVVHKGKLSDVITGR